MRAASKSRRVAGILVRPALWFCACNLLAAVLAAQCSNPTQVPNQTISSGTYNFPDNNALTASNVVINGSASVTFVAGNCIQLLPGFHATAGTAGTTFHAWVETAPAAVSVSPVGGSGLNQPFTWTVSSPSGYSNLSDMFALFNTSVSGVNACYIHYNRTSNLLYLADNTGAYWIGGFVPGSSGSAGNASCSIYGSGSSVIGSGTQLALTVSVTFLTSFSGTKNEYLIGYDNQGLNTTWEQMGTWTVPAPQQYQLTTAVSPSGEGSISPASGWYSSGSVVTITATAASGYQFNGFTGGVNSGSNPLTVTMNGAMSETANFTQTATQYQLTTTVSPSGGGTVSPSCPGGCMYNSGSQVTITATPVAGYQFASFTGSVSSGSNPLTVTLNGPISETANFAVPIGTSSYLQANLGWMPFNYYDTAHSASSFGFSNSCPSGASVQSCFQTILGQLRAQSVTGVRIFIPLCDAFPDCGTSSSWNPGQTPAQQTWIANVGSFFQDVANAGIANVTITITTEGSTVQVAANSTSSPNGSCPSNCSKDAGTYVVFDPVVPYGMSDGTNTPLGFALGDFWYTADNQGYNKAPINNTNFIGWTNYFNAINAILGAAKGRVYDPVRGLEISVDGLEISQELNPMAFTAMMRYFYDNSSPQTAPSQYQQTVQTTNGPVLYANVLSALRSLMSANGFVPGRVFYSAAWQDPALNNDDNCANFYSDYARNGGLDSITRTINGGPVGIPGGTETGADGLVCGGTIDSSMVPSPIYSTQPNIVDLHMYPQVNGTQNNDLMIQQVAAVDYGDVPHFLAEAGLQSAAIVIGETYGGTLSPLNLGTAGNPNYCWFGTYPSPPGAPIDNVAGFNNEGISNPLSGYTVTFRPWMNLSGQCFAYGSNGPGTPGNYQAINYNGLGPYTPTHK